MILRFSQKLGSRLQTGSLKPSPLDVSPVAGFSRSVTESMNGLIDFAKVILTDEEISPFDLGFRLNDLLPSAAATDESRVFGKPRDAFRALVADSRTP